MEHKTQLTTLYERDSIIVDEYLQEAKQIGYSLALANLPVPSQDLIDHMLLGLGKEYDTLAGIVNQFLGSLSLQVRTKILLHEQRLKDIDSSATYQAFAFQSVSQIHIIFRCAICSRWSWQRTFF